MDAGYYQYSGILHRFPSIEFIYLTSGEISSSLGDTRTRALPAALIKGSAACAHFVMLSIIGSKGRSGGASFYPRCVG